MTQAPLVVQQPTQLEGVQVEPSGRVIPPSMPGASPSSEQATASTSAAATREQTVIKERGRIGHLHGKQYF